MYSKPKAYYESNFLPWQTASSFPQHATAASFVPNGFACSSLGPAVSLVHERYRFRPKAEPPPPEVSPVYAPVDNYSVDSYWPHVITAPALASAPQYNTPVYALPEQTPQSSHHETAKKVNVILPECTKVPPPPLGVVPAPPAPPPLPRTPKGQSPPHHKKKQSGRSRGRSRSRNCEKATTLAPVTRDLCNRSTGVETTLKVTKALLKKGSTLLSGKTVTKANFVPPQGDSLHIDATLETNENPPYWNRYVMRRPKLIYTERTCWPEGVPTDNDPRYAVLCARLQWRRQNSKVLYDSVLDCSAGVVEKGDMTGKRKSRFDMKPD
ncbi:uncharacterized protein LOC129593319 isoform X2 [Paramacrobiotus metropolitanus]|uniref:uncharacterized protein LOC129593319 isoform X2 n=1 Tax=Paramacrobiotus metropolitanus TaxID=2943436 RepID=UPI002445E1F3|nr:uncharacterized protein LOC129593319 isoform X2 [Paramacrobiotus metropolitanus]